MQNTVLKPFETIHLWVQQSAEKWPDKPAIWYQGQLIDFKTLNAKANQLANLLGKDTSVNGACVGICLERSPELLI
jgi:non-ribosomal peptide synthetase component F